MLSAQGRSTSGHRSALVRLRWIGVALPLAALLVAETIRYLIPGEGNDVAMHLLWGAGAGAAIVLFAGAMFWWIGRAESEIVRQNLELGAVNAIARAVQDQPSSRGAVEAALESLVASTRASRATVRLFAPDGERAAEPTVFTTRGSSPEPPGQPVELPLATGSALVGLLRSGCRTGRGATPFGSRHSRTSRTSSAARSSSTACRGPAAAAGGS